MTHNQQLDDLRAEIEGMPCVDGDYVRVSDVLRLVSRLQGHLTAMEALEQLVKFCEERRAMATINDGARSAYNEACQLGERLMDRVKP